MKIEKTRGLRVSLRFIFWHISIVTLIVSGEILSLVLSKVVFNPFVLGAFYIYNFSTFYFISFYVLPLAIRNIHSISIRIFSIICSFAGYIAISFFIMLGFTYYYSGKLQFILVGNFMSLIIWRGFLFFISAIAYWFARHNIKRVKETKELEIQKLEAEKREAKLQSAFLRSQIDVHLLINTLNSIYARLHEASPSEANALLLAADILSYSQANNDENGMVTLHQEIGYYKKFIQLHQHLHAGSLNINLTNEVKGKDNAIRLPPLLFMDLIQNLIKYGVLNDPLHSAEIKIGATTSSVNFYTRNIIAHKHVPFSSGIGLENIQARLKKHFGGNFSLNINTNDKYFEVILNIVL